jgi:hypothetical protein
MPNYALHPPYTTALIHARQILLMLSPCCLVHAPRPLSCSRVLQPLCMLPCQYISSVSTQYQPTPPPLTGLLGSQEMPCLHASHVCFNHGSHHLPRHVGEEGRGRRIGARCALAYFLKSFGGRTPFQASLEFSTYPSHRPPSPAPSCSSPHPPFGAYWFFKEQVVFPYICILHNHDHALSGTQKWVCETGGCA